MKVHRSSLLGAMLATVFMTSAVSADDALVPGESILDRARPELDPLGIRVGVFSLYPRIDMVAEYESNILAQTQDELDDFIVRVAPSVLLESDWIRHSLRLSAASTFAEYQEYEGENTEDHELAADLTLDVSNASRLRFTSAFRKAHEDRFAPDDNDSFDPTLFKETRLAAFFARRVGKLSLRAGARQKSTDFEDGRNADGIINNDDRNRDVFTYSLRGGYQIRPDVDALLQVEVDRRDYEFKPDDRGINRDSKDLRIAAGVQGALTGSTYLEALAGYSEREYDDTRLAIEDISWFEGRLVWNPSGLTTVTLAGLRGFNETSIDGAAGYSSTRFGIRVDHELKRNILLHLDSFLLKDKYAGIDRSDDVYAFEIGVRYLMNRNLQVAVEARQRDRDSSATNRPDLDFTSNRIMLSLRAHR